MKKLHLIIIIFISFNSYLTAQSWIALSTLTTTTLNSVYFLNKDTGFVGGGNGSTCVFQKTINGGGNWIAITPPQTTFINKIFFITNDTGYILIGSNYQLYKTNNGGITWSYFRDFGSSSLYFQNSSVGFVRGTSYMYRTLNGGTTWDSISITGITTIPNWFEINFLSSSIGYISNMPNSIWKTTNSGGSWSLLSTPVSSPYQLYDFKFRNSNLGFFISANSPTSVFGRTMDGGTTWTSISLPASTVGVLSKIVCTPNKVFISGSNYMYVSTDSGNTWTSMTGPPSIMLVDFYMTNDSVGYGINTGTVYKTSPGIVAAPTTASSIFFIGNITNTSMQLNWTSGNGSSRIVVACAGSNTLVNPTYSVSYSASSTFGSGSQIGSGNYVVYNGTGNSCTVSGLSLNTAYYYRVYEYNGTGTNANYLTSSFATAGAMTLPVKLISFTAEKNNNEVNLNWQTASEMNNDYFEVERSPSTGSGGSSSIEGWEIIGKVKGHGSTSVINDYHFTDDISNIQPPISNIYYRLKQFDFNGQYEYSKVISVSMEKNNSSDIMIYPNPTTNLLNIETGSNINYSAEIFDVAGRSVSEKVSFNHQLSINIQQLSKGIYFLRCTSENSQISKMLVVK